MAERDDRVRAVKALFAAISQRTHARETHVRDSSAVIVGVEDKVARELVICIEEFESF